MTAPSPEQGTPEPVSVLIVDDDPMVRQQVRFVLGMDARVTVVGDCGDGASVLSEVERVRPRVVLMDVSMPIMTGVEATAALAQRHDGGPAVIALTAMDHDDSLLAMLRAGARGFVPKEYADEDLVTAIVRVAAGGGYVSPHCQPMLFAHLDAGKPDSGQAAAAQQLSHLTGREIAVARHVATGARTADIARALYVSESTVKSHLDSIRTKLGVASREEIAVLVERAGAAAEG
ncbi:response regulator [Demequina sp.]|uniref:response regulator n=1 Tax=Demequina sp. TaxID=2050685 RepID=UPI003A8BE505